MSYCYYWSCFISYYDTSLCCILCIAILLRIILLRCVLPLRVITSSIVLHHVTFFLLPLRGLIIHIYSLTLFLLFIHLDLFHFLCCSITLYFISYNLLFALSYFTISYAASPNIHASLQYFAYIFIQLHRVFLTNDFIDYHRNCFMYITIILFSLRHFNFTLVITHLRCMIYWCFVVTVFFTSSYYTISYAASPNLHASLRYSTYVFIHLHRVFLTNDFFWLQSKLLPVYCCYAFLCFVTFNFTLFITCFCCCVQWCFVGHCHCIVPSSNWIIYSASSCLFDYDRNLHLYTTSTAYTLVNQLCWLANNFFCFTFVVGIIFVDCDAGPFPWFWPKPWQAGPFFFLILLRNSSRIPNLPSERPACKDSLR